MKFGKDLLFWIRLIAVIAKFLLGMNPSDPENPNNGD